MRVAEELWSGKAPSYKHLRVFGCEAYCHIPKENRNKLQPKSKKCVFLGYGESGEMGFRLWDPEARRIVRSHSVFFDENKMQTKLVKSMAAKRVVFQDSEPVQGVQAGGQAPQPQDIEEEVREDEQEVA